MNSHMTLLIGVHEMHDQMQSNHQDHATTCILVAQDSLSPLVYPMITHALPETCL